MRLPVNRLAALGLLTFTAACGQFGAMPPASAAAALQGSAVQGPAGDYPIVLGDPYVIDGVTYTPSDKLNSDQVGYAVPGGEGGGAITVAHRTLPLPSYVEITSLRTGRTILARVERRGPMTGTGLVELSPGAAAQLGDEGTRMAVRVRRVNPPEADRALLRTGQSAPPRMDTPMSLVAVLQRKLDPAMPAPAPSAAPAEPAPAAAPVPMAGVGKATKARSAKAAAKTATTPAPTPAPAKPAEPPKNAGLPAKPAVRPATEKASAQKPSARPKPSAGQGRFVVQVGAFSNADGAARAARQVGGTVSSAGRFHRVRIGRFATAAQASAALAKAKAAGYSDARIQRAD